MDDKDTIINTETQAKPVEVFDIGMFGGCKSPTKVGCSCEAIVIMERGVQTKYRATPVRFSSNYSCGTDDHIKPL